jgi:putative Mg2+ transporter-C (MgtC) family protein
VKTLLEMSDSFRLLPHLIAMSIAYVRGTATAASLWATGATGAAVGLGAYDVAVVISLFTFLTLWLLVPFKQEGPKTEEDVKKPPSEI